MFTNTIGDPDRGERIASAVLADPDARAEITAPITDAVMELSGVPTGMQPTVEAVVDQILRDPAGAQAFVEPFAASWARLLGEDDPRPTEFDLTRMLGELETAISPLGVDLVSDTAEELIVPSVPLPRAQLDWMGSVRRGIRAAILPFALAAVGFAAAAFATGDRRRVLRRVGFWATGAGLLWILIPPLINAAMRAWAPGADSVVAVTVDEATSGLRVPALVLVLSGLATVAGSFVVPPARREDPVDAAPSAGAPPGAAPAPPPAPPPASPPAPPPAAPTPSAPPVAPHAVTIAAPHPEPPIDGPDDVEPVDDDDPSVWDYYSR